MGHLAHGPANRGRRVLETAAPLFVCEPPESPRGGVVVVHGLRGLTDEVESACRRLARDGWLAVAPYLYHPRGGPAFGPAGADRARAELSGLTLDDLRGDVTAAVSHIAGRGCLGTAVIGLGTGHDGFPPLGSFAGGQGLPLLEPGLEVSWPRVDGFLSQAGLPVSQ